MADDPSLPGPPAAPVDAGGSAAQCPWCSAVLPLPDAAQCPSCGAHLLAPEGVAIPGVTELDSAFFVTGGAARAPRPSLGLPIGRDQDEAPMSVAEQGAVATPDLEVRREMLRLELAAKLAELQREARAIESERAVSPEADDSDETVESADPATPEP